jgi:hypothetical protein
LIVMVVARENPAHRPDVGIAGTGPCRPGFTQEGGMPRARETMMVGA